MSTVAWSGHQQLHLSTISEKEPGPDLTLKCQALRSRTPKSYYAEKLLQDFGSAKITYDFNRIRSSMSVLVSQIFLGTISYTQDANKLLLDWTRGTPVS